jgi:hypothetical protein
MILIFTLTITIQNCMLNFENMKMTKLIIMVNSQIFFLKLCAVAIHG